MDGCEAALAAGQSVHRACGTEMLMLPEEFVNELSDIGLGDAAEAIAMSEPEVSVRVNRRKPATGGVLSLPGNEPVPWCAEGVYLAQRPVFALDPQWHQGRYYVQEAGSMYVGHVVRCLCRGADRPMAVLDACAAPGGKTTAVMDALPEGSLVMANEYVPSRAAVLRENVIKWGYPAAIVTRGDTAALGRMGGVFDIVIADVPCSGEGMMRKDSDAVAQWSRGLVQECAARQWKIVCNLWKSLRPGGVMVYSTCTFNREENELTVRRIIDDLGGESVEVAAGEAPGITGAIGEGGAADTSLHCCRFVPGRTRGEGLFVSAVRKRGGKEEDAMMRFKSDVGRGGKAKRRGAVAVPDLVNGWIDCPEIFAVYADGERVSAFPAAWAGLLAEVRRHVDVIHEGVHVGTLKGRDIVPAHGLAMSTAFNKSVFACVDIDADTALRYLRGESPVLPGDVERGYVALCYEGEPLGLVKNLGRRTNSLYPAPWRLRMK